jgi:hypothetical protein
MALVFSVFHGNAWLFLKKTCAPPLRLYTSSCSPEARPENPRKPKPFRSLSLESGNCALRTFLPHPQAAGAQETETGSGQKLRSGRPPDGFFLLFFEYKETNDAIYINKSMLFLNKNRCFMF